MPPIALSHFFPLPRDWPRRVRSAVVQVVSLARTSLALTQGWALDLTALPPTRATTSGDPPAARHGSNLAHGGRDDPGAPRPRFSFAVVPEPSSTSKSATMLVGDTCRSSRSSGLPNALKSPRSRGPSDSC